MLLRTRRSSSRWTTSLRLTQETYPRRNERVVEEAMLALRRRTASVAWSVL